IYISEPVMAVQIIDSPKASTSWSSLCASFEKTFIREARWKLIAEGIEITIIISLLAALFGTLLGFGICGLRLSGNRIANGSALAFIRIMQGMPMVVLLMILFYVVFAKTGLSSIWVAVIGFGMNFGAYVSEMIRTGILAVDKGQMEAALALGYTKPKAFIRMVLPQAAQHFLPVYQGEFISLVKMTAVVGYIAIQDLTKAGDIIRSRTYEAFFPLISVAIIYFIIAWLLTRILVALQRRLDPKQRRKMENKG
ncbi:MAG: amino acid ABC transporter permease, partial [Spirochaetia bacterium]|nr:amino acid ABC transporter permease [Spirochaetia bacterium]